MRSGLPDGKNRGRKRTFGILKMRVLSNRGRKRHEMDSLPKSARNFAKKEEDTG